MVYSIITFVGELQKILKTQIRKKAVFTTAFCL